MASLYRAVLPGKVRSVIPVSLAVVVAMAAPVSGVEVRAPIEAPTQALRGFTFVDRGAVRVAWRGDVAGTDDAPVDVVYEDPGSGRTAHARVGSGVIVKGDVAALAEEEGVVVITALMPSRRLWLVRSRDAREDGLALAQRLMPLVQAGVVDEAFPNLRLRHQLAAAIGIPPDDPKYGAQFFLDDIGIEGAWALSIGDPGVVVAVVDNGCDTQHPDLIGKLDPGHDVVDDDDDPTFFPNEQSNEHGTACTGLIAAVTDNNLDVAGVCPLCRATCTRLLPGASEDVPLDADVRAFGFALEDDVDVVSNSWGFVDAIPVPGVLADAIEEVATEGRGGRGAVVVFAAGNDSRAIGDDELLAVEGVIGVGAVNNLGELTQFSNTGRSVDVVAPTGSVSTDISGADGDDDGDVTVRFGGTSSACPLVAGVAALLISVEPELTREDVEGLLEDSAKQSALADPGADGHDDEYGFGLVQPEAALRLLDDPPPNIKGGAGCDCGDDKEGEAALGLGALALLRRRRRRPVSSR